MYSFYQSGYLETFKQVINKLSKNRSSPLPLVFANVDAMELISKNKNLLRGVFKVFDTRNFGRYFKKYEGQMQLNYTHRVQLYQRVPMRHTLKLQLTFLDLKMLEESIETSFSSSLLSTTLSVSLSVDDQLVFLAFLSEYRSLLSILLKLKVVQKGSA